MSDGLEQLRALGAQKIHEQTHIVRQHVQAVLHETFDDMTKVQFSGFVSILEREYGVDLSDLRAKGEEYYSNISLKNEENLKVFVAPKKKKKYTFIYMIIALIIFAIAVSFTMNFSVDKSLKLKSQIIDNIAIENAKDSMSHNASIQDSNESSIVEEIEEVEEVEPEIVEVVEVIKSFKIMPKSRLWLGYIDLDTHRKYQKTFSDELSLDPEKDWILTLGHGHVNVEINEKQIEFGLKKNVRFLYKDGNLTSISFTEFKKLNRGKKW